MKYYSVPIGRIPGLYKSWEEAEKQVKHFSGAKFRVFSSLQDAEEYFNKHTEETVTGHENNVH